MNISFGRRCGTEGQANSGNGIEAFVVVPEPAILSLFTFGGLALRRRLGSVGASR